MDVADEDSILDYDHLTKTYRNTSSLRNWLAKLDWDIEERYSPAEWHDLRQHLLEKHKVADPYRIGECLAKKTHPHQARGGVVAGGTGCRRNIPVGTAEP